MDLSQSYIAYLLLKETTDQLSLEESTDLKNWKQASGVTDKELNALNSLLNLRQRSREYEEAHRRAEQINSPVALLAPPPVGRSSDLQPHVKDLLFPLVSIKIRVTDTSGRPLSGATITVEKYENLGVTDAEGISSIDVTVGDIVFVSCIDFASKKYVIKDGDSVVDVVLSQDFVEFEGERSSDRQPPVHRVHFLRRSWFRYAAAIILLTGTIIAIVVSSDRQSDKSKDLSKKIINDILPGSNKAILTLGDGSTIILDSTQNGTIANQGNSSIIKLSNGQIRYDVKGLSHDSVMMNTMTTPRGGMYQLTLSDGSKVWLNAASSIKYPAVFSGNERKVEISGEAYFEVAKDKAKPFIVVVNKDFNIQVLGTYFNVKAFPDEPEFTTTLVEGSVRVRKGFNVIVLKPGEQAVLNNTTKCLTSILNIDTEQAIAWKKGYFQFDRDNIKEVMRQLARWYNVEVVYTRGNSRNESYSMLYNNTNLIGCKV